MEDFVTFEIGKIKKKEMLIAMKDNTIRFNELYRLVTTQPLISTDLQIIVDGKYVTNMSINYDKYNQPVIKLKTNK